MSLAAFRGSQLNHPYPKAALLRLATGMMLKQCLELQPLDVEEGMGEKVAKFVAVAHETASFDGDIHTLHDALSALQVGGFSDRSERGLEDLQPVLQIFDAVWGVLRKDPNFPPGAAIAESLNKAERRRLEQNLARARREMDKAHAIIQNGARVLGLE